MIQATASAPAPGCRNSSTPKATETSPLRIISHSPLISLRRRMAATICSTPVITAQAAMYISSTSPVMPGMMKVITPTTMPTRPHSSSSHQWRLSRRLAMALHTPSRPSAST